LTPERARRLLELDDKGFEIAVADDAGVVVEAGLVLRVLDGTGAKIASYAISRLVNLLSRFPALVVVKKTNTRFSEKSV
jgi:hypothetical protein